MAEFKFWRLRTFYLCHKYFDPKIFIRQLVKQQVVHWEEKTKKQNRDKAAVSEFHSRPGIFKVPIFHLLSQLHFSSCLVRLTRQTAVMSSGEKLLQVHLEKLPSLLFQQISRSSTLCSFSDPYCPFYTAVMQPPVIS